MNISAPINKTGYGIASLNIFRELYKLCDTISYFPIGQPGVDNKEDYDMLTKCINNCTELKPDDPYLKIWHQFDLAARIGNGKYFAYPFFELDTFNKMEKIHLSIPDTIIVSCNWAKQVLIDNGLRKNIIVAPLGVDPKIFNVKRNNISEDRYIFANIGKWEVRKGHDILLDLFTKAFPNETNVELWILASESTNNYSSPEELSQWKNMYSKDNRIKLYTGFNSHEDIANFIGKINCGIFPSRAEGWNLELLECMAMNKPVIATGYSAHTEFCNKNNCYIIDIDSVEKAYDGKAFKGQGNWAKIESKQIDQIIEYMRFCYKNKINSNIEGIETAKQLSWHNTANNIYRCMY